MLCVGCVIQFVARSACKKYSLQSFIMSNNSVSIIIPTKNEEDHIGACIKSCLDQDYDSVEIIVIDNYSTDSTREIANRMGVQVYEQGPERSSQKNFGAKKANGDYVLFLDADARLTKSVVSDCVCCAEENGWQMVIIPERHIGEGYWAEVKALERSFYLGDDTVEAPWFYNREAFVSVGGYDEDMYAGEDWDLFDRMRKAGYSYGRCKVFINHQLGKIGLLDTVRKKMYYGKNIEKFLASGKGEKARRNPIFRYSLFNNWRYLFKSPFKYVGIFVLKLFEGVGIVAGMMLSKL